MLSISKTLPLIFLSFLLAAFTPAYGAKKTAPAPKSQPKASAEAKLDKLPIAYLAQDPQSPPVLPFFEQAVTDRGVQGARLGIQDNNTTGRFTRQNFSLRESIVPPDGDVAAAFKALLADGHRHILLNLESTKIRELAALPESKNVLLYDIATRDDEFRGEACRPNVLHLLPSRAMRADALGQYLAKKRWNKWFLAAGPNDGDKLYAEAVKRAAKRFGAKIVAERTWQHSFDERRTPESEVPVFTQGVEYDILIVADESGLFGDFLPYRTWQPRPVAGTQGLVATAWHRTHEAWGALQLQNRFRDQAGRWMTEEDYGAWLAVRAIGESATRTKSVDFDKVKTFMLGEEFALAGFKGVPLSFRRWNGQLRQPVLIASERSMVAVAPVEGFLHPKNELDTLGYDEPESKCRF